ncbi:MAG TPA: AMP-binding protein, partial [Myxococcaceae bacterium]
MPFDVHQILAPLDPVQSADTEAPAWLQESWTDPEGFVTALASASSSRGALPLKSRPGQYYDLFHDLLVRHAGSEHVALRTYDRVNGWQALGYRQLHEQATRRAAQWARQGVKPGASLCLLLAPGPELLVSFMAALGLGACVSFLPPQGQAFVSRRLAALAPQYIAAEPHHAPLVQGFEKGLLRNQGEVAPLFTSHTYVPKEPLGRFFSPLAEPSHIPLPLAAADAWACALRDGLLTWGLSPGDHLAVPGMSVPQHLPALLFATLLRGATFVHLDLGDLERDPSLLLKQPLHVLGVCPALRDLMLRSQPLNLGTLSHWFRNPEEPSAWDAWRRWVEHCGLGSVPTSNVLVDSTAGGAVLSSPRHKGPPLSTVFPAPGRRWVLRDLNLSGQPAPGDVGLFTLLPDEGRPPGHAVLSRMQDCFRYAGPRDARREGRVYPYAEVTAALGELPFVAGASVVALPSGGSLGHHLFLLLVFTGAESRDTTQSEAPSRRQQLRRR